MTTNDMPDIIAGLTAPHATISSKYFYDARGSALFDAITRLPEYYPTRTEISLMQAHAQDIANTVGSGRTLIELGAGNCSKAMLLSHCITPQRFIGVDISAEYLQTAIQTLRREFPAMDVRAVAADLSHDIELPADIARPHRLLFYPGSSIGNFDRQQALGLLQRMRRLIDLDGALLIGIDLPKDLAVLKAAYNDAAGVTAAFNLNILSHVNQLIGSDFDLSQWQHLSFFNPVESRIEMHLQARSDTVVHWVGGERSFAAGQRIQTENSYKYPLEDFKTLLQAAGFPNTKVWTDPRHWFALLYAQP